MVNTPYPESSPPSVVLVLVDLATDMYLPVSVPTSEKCRLSFLLSICCLTMLSLMFGDSPTILDSITFSLMLPSLPTTLLLVCGYGSPHAGSKLAWLYGLYLRPSILQLRGIYGSPALRIFL